MPAVIEQINAMSMSDKMQIMEYIMKSIARAVEEANAKEPMRNSDFARFAGRWSVEEGSAFDLATARSIDDEDWK